MILGISTAWLTIFIVSSILKMRRRWLRALSLGLVSLCLFTATGIFLKNLFYQRALVSIPVAGLVQTSYCSPGETTVQNILTEYHMTIEPVDFSAGYFNISEDVTNVVESSYCNSDFTVTTNIIDENTIHLPERKTRSSNRGLFFREIRIKPLEDASISDKKSTCCSGSSIVELRDFPRNSFYEARYEPDTAISYSYYLDNETIMWDLRSTNDVIEFSYITSPFNAIRSLLSPIINITYQSHWPIAFLGFIVSSVITPIVKPVLVDLSKSKFKLLLEKDRIKRDQQPSLHVRGGEMMGMIMPIPPMGLTIGRGSGCQIKLQEKDISRSHATILLTSRGFCLRDDGSSLGTFLNGQRLTSHELLPLTHGDVIGMGYHQLFEFRIK